MAYYSLVASSTLFLGPTAYGFYRGHRMLPIVSFITTVASVAYWLDPSSREKRAFDLLVSKTSGVIYFVYGCKYIASPSMRMYGYANIMGILMTYQMSCFLYPSMYWIPSHMLFHYMTALGKFLVVHSSA
jgi:hypothetical protein